MDEIDFRDVYAAPHPAASKPGDERGPDEEPDLRFLALWERRRVVYNGVLAVVVLLASGIGRWRSFLDPAFWELLIVGALGANLCFCAGPIAEAYLRWIGIRWRWVGRMVFAAGLLLSVPVTFFVVLASLMAKMGY